MEGVLRRQTRSGDGVVPSITSICSAELRNSVSAWKIAPSAYCGNASDVAIPDLFGMHDSHTAFAAMATLLAAALLSALLIIALAPWLARYAMAEPNARSSHKLPTPQGGGIAVIGAAIVVSGAPCFSRGRA